MGIIPRISEDIFEHIFAMDENLEFHIKVCVNVRVALYGVKSRLLGSHRDLQILATVRDSDITLSGISPFFEK